MIYLRAGVPRDPNRLADLLQANMANAADALAKGSIVIIEPGRMRIRALPIDDD